ncbi:MAG: hypothetical protein HY821_22260, partial [Acidobacteria bacterium]|nr:hypothetical protein [Acidobacteriota bacterium]
MQSTTEPLLANLIGYSTGSLLFAIFLFLLLKDRAGRRLPSSAITICAAALAIFLFALSFTHLHSENTTHAWAMELAIHHAGVPLALFVLMQE